MEENEKIKKQLQEELDKLLEEIKNNAKKREKLMNPDEDKEYEFFKRRR